MINRCVLVGRLTRDPVARKAQSGTTVTSFSIAIDRIARAGQEKQTDFINCVCFGKTAEFVEQYIRKGFLVGVDGRIQTGSYEDNTGRRVYTTDVVCDTVQNYEPRNSARQQTGTSTSASYGNSGQQSYGNQSYGNAGYTSEPQYSNTSDDDFSPTLDISSDDLPF